MKNIQIYIYKIGIPIKKYSKDMIIIIEFKPG